MEDKQLHVEVLFVFNGCRYISFRIFFNDLAPDLGLGISLKPKKSNSQGHYLKQHFQ
jgi:hypothetical protein